MAYRTLRLKNLTELVVFYSRTAKLLGPKQPSRVLQKSSDYLKTHAFNRFFNCYISANLLPPQEFKMNRFKVVDDVLVLNDSDSETFETDSNTQRRRRVKSCEYSDSDSSSSEMKSDDDIDDRPSSSASNTSNETNKSSGSNNSFQNIEVKSERSSNSGRSSQIAGSSRSRGTKSPESAHSSQRRSRSRNRSIKSAKTRRSRPTCKKFCLKCNCKPNGRSSVKMMSLISELCYIYNKSRREHRNFQFFQNIRRGITCRHRNSSRRISYSPRWPRISRSRSSSRNDSRQEAEASDSHHSAGSADEDAELVTEEVGMKADEPVDLNVDMIKSEPQEEKSNSSSDEDEQATSNAVEPPNHSQINICNAVEKTFFFLLSLPINELVKVTLPCLQALNESCSGSHQGEANGNYACGIYVPSSSSGLPSTGSSSVPSSEHSCMLAKGPLQNLILRNGFVVVYTDGACLNNGKRNAKAGIGVWFGDNHPSNIGLPLKGKATNNRAEIISCIVALKMLKNEGYHNVALHSDSQYVVRAITLWVQNWIKNGWINSDKKPVKNKEEFQRLLEISESMNVNWIHVAAHQKIKGNEEADKLARKGAEFYTPDVHDDNIYS